MKVRIVKCSPEHECWWRNRIGEQLKVVGSRSIGEVEWHDVIDDSTLSIKGIRKSDCEVVEQACQHEHVERGTCEDCGYDLMPGEEYGS